MIKSLILLCFLCTSVLSLEARERSANDSDLLVKADSLYFKGDFTAAIPFYQQFLKKSGNALIWQRLAFCYHMNSNYLKAVETYKTSLAKNPNPVLKNYILLRLAQAFSLEKEKDSSFHYLDRLADEGYNNYPSIDTTTSFKTLLDTRQSEIIRNKIFANAYPCTKNPRNSDFDFWVGEWDVYITGTNNLVGKSKIEKAQGGCSIQESFTALQVPSAGHSINYFNSEENSWEQLYVSSGGVHRLFTKGVYKDSAMHFIVEQSPSTPFRGNFIFYNINPKEVRQYLEISTDGGKTYQASYDYTYRRTQ